MNKKNFFFFRTTIKRKPKEIYWTYYYSIKAYSGPGLVQLK